MRIARTLFDVGIGQCGQQLPQDLWRAGRARGQIIGLAAHLGSRAVPGQHLEADHARGIQVGAPVGVGAPQLFRREIAWRAHHDRHAREPRHVGRDGDAEVGEPHMRPFDAGRIQQQVGRLHVAVHDPRIVHRPECREHLPHQLGGVARRQRAVPLHQVGDGAALDDRHGEEHPVVLAGPAERGDHSRMVDAHPLLAHEPQQRPRIGLPQHLGGDDALPPQVAHPPYGAHAALADLIDQFIAAGEHLAHPLLSLAFADGRHHPNAVGWWRPVSRTERGRGRAACRGRDRPGPTSRRRRARSRRPGSSARCGSE